MDENKIKVDINLHPMITQIPPCPFIQQISLTQENTLRIKCFFCDKLHLCKGEQNKECPCKDIRDFMREFNVVE